MSLTGYFYLHRTVIPASYMGNDRASYLLFKQHGGNYLQGSRGTMVHMLRTSPEVH